MLGLPLLGLQLGPVLEHLRRAKVRGRAEDVGVAAFNLVADGVGHVGERKGLLLVGQLGVKDNLKQQVAQLFSQRPPRPAKRHPVHLVQHLVAFLDQVRPQAAQVLLPVPRATSRRPQPPHDFHQPLGGLSDLAHGAAISKSSPRCPDSSNFRPLT
jgi:hypothetical protein